MKALAFLSPDIENLPFEIEELILLSLFCFTELFKGQRCVNTILKPPTLGKLLFRQSWYTLYFCNMKIPINQIDFIKDY